MRILLAALLPVLPLTPVVTVSRTAGHRRVKGTGTTPLGTDALLSVLGTTRIRRADHGVQDNASPALVHRLDPDAAPVIAIGR